MMSQLSSHAAELKSQGAAEAARDPNSSVTSQDAQKTILDETKKAGGAAFSFNPNASPEEKAAVARANVPAGFHHENKPKAVGIVTDIDDGSPDQYDLPAPSKEGAISVPSSPTTIVPGKQNGHVPLDDEARWRDRVGWAPRFGQGSITEAEANESLLDHATLLESKLDDKFFGDWYHNTAVIVFACLSSWVVAQLGGGLGWLFIVMACCGTYYRTSIRRVRRNYRDDVHREMAKARLETDTESLEWINNFLVKFWPIYAPVLCETIINSVDQVLSTSTPAFLDSLRLSFFTLGTKPPRLDHVKTYPRADDDMVLMDWKFSFTPNDTMDLTARQLKNKINPKVVLEVRVGKGVISKGLDVIVEDFAFSGLMRVKVKLQTPFPHIEKVEFCFLGRPDIDYVCKPLGGDLLGIDINFIPGLESFIKEQIHGNLQPIMYEPNVFPIEIAKMLSGSPVDQAIGVMAVTIHGAQGLKNPDKLAGSPDPYTVVSLNSRNALGKTKIVKQSANPRWNETIHVIITSLTDTLTLQVFDYNEYRKDKELGTASFALDQLGAASEHENLQLEVLANGKARGILQTDVRFFPVLEGVKLEGGIEEPPPESNTGIARFTVEQAKDLDGSKSIVGQLNPYAVLLLNGKEIHISQKLKRTNQPIWADASKEILITERKSARLGLVIKDSRDVSADPILGTYQIKLDEMMQMMEKGKEWYQLSGAKTGRAKLTLQWKPVALKGAMGGSGGYIKPIGVLRLHFQSARDLKNVETMGKSDPYVRVLLSGIEKGKTLRKENELNPKWDEVMYIPMHSPRERLIVEVMDYQNIGKDRSLGLTELLAADYIHETDNGEYKVQDDKRKVLSEPLRMNGKGIAKGTLNFTVAFYPTLNVMDPEDEEEGKTAEPTTNGVHSRNVSKNSISQVPTRKSIEGDPIALANEKEHNAGRIDANLAKQLTKAEEEQRDGPNEAKITPKLRLTAEDLVNYESGLLIFKLLDADLARSNVHLEVLMDEMAFPSYVSSKARSKHSEFGETGDVFVRELDVSRITLRLMEKQDKKGGDQASDHTIAKLEGDTLLTLQSCLYKPTELTLKGADGSLSKIRVLLKYLPVKMQLDPSESINNQGTLRVDLIKATNLPVADSNGYSDPYCKFYLNNIEEFASKVMKKNLNPVWDQFVNLEIPSRTAAEFKIVVNDEDTIGKDDFLGETLVNLEYLEPMQSKTVVLQLSGNPGKDGKPAFLHLRLLFSSAYVRKSRQRSSTFGGTFSAPVKVIGAPVKGVGKVGVAVGGGVVKGASFFRHGLRSKNDSRDISNGVVEPSENVVFLNGDSAVDTSSTIPEGTVLNSDEVPPVPFTPPPNGRAASFGNQSMVDGASRHGTATFTNILASGYPASAKVQVHIKQIGAKDRDARKTKGRKASSGQGQIRWDEELSIPCTADARFQIQVKDEKIFKDEDLGEGVLGDEKSPLGSSGSEQEQSVEIGSGTIMFKSRFELSDGTSGSPSHRRSGVIKKNITRGVTPS